MSMTDKQKLELYRATLMSLCEKNGGEIEVEMIEGATGTLMNRIEPGHGNGGWVVRYRYVKDGRAS